MQYDEIEEFIRHLGLGLYVDFEQWENKGWVRIQTNQIPSMEPLILWKDESRAKTTNSIGRYIFKMGEESIKNGMADLLNLQRSNG